MATPVGAQGAPARIEAGDLVALLRAALEDGVLDADVQYGEAVLTLDPGALVKAARLCKSDERLAFDFFDWMSGVDLGDEGFAVVTHLYSVRHRHHVNLRVVAAGGREEPVLPTLTGVYAGANWGEREAYDMFGISFEGHPGLLPRILTVENFEGWPLRKDFLLTTREAKAWPGAKEPEDKRSEAEEQTAQLITGDAPAESEAGAAAEHPDPSEVGREEVEYDREVFDRLVAEGKSERVARAKAKAAAMRARKAGGAAEPAPDERADAGSEAAASGGAAEPAADERADAGDEEPASGGPAEPAADARADAAEELQGGDTAGAAAAQAREQAGDPAAQTPEGAATIAAQDMADPSIAKDAAAGAVGGDTAAGAPGDEPGTAEPVSHVDHERDVGEGAGPEASGTPGAEAEGRHTGAVEQSGDQAAADTPGMTADTDAPSAREPVETPAPGPESDVADTSDEPGSGAHRAGSPANSDDDT